MPQNSLEMVEHAPVRLLAVMCLLAVTSACGPGATTDPPNDDTDYDVQDAADAGGDVTDDTGTDARTDASTDADNDADADATSPTYPAIYTDDRTHSPLTAHVVAHLRDVAGSATATDDVFAKIGDSHTVSQNFMHCFAGDGVALDGRDALDPTIAHFLAGDAAGTNPYERESEAAVVGWSAVSMIDGAPSPFEQEIDALEPRFGLVQFGTNDIGLGDIYGYHDAMAHMAEALLARGTIPVFTLEGQPDTASCIRRAHQSMNASLGAGVYYFVLDSFVADGDVRDGDYLFVLLRE